MRVSHGALEAVTPVTAFIRHVDSEFAVIRQLRISIVHDHASQADFPRLSLREPEALRRSFVS